MNRPYGQTHASGKNPTAGGASPAPTNTNGRWINNVGEGLAPPAEDATNHAAGRRDAGPYKENWLPSLVISNQPAGW